MKVSDIINSLKQLAPQAYAASFDNTGLLTGDKNTVITGVLVSLDCLENVVDEAIDNSCNMIVCFHPIIFSGLKHLQPNNYVNRAVIKAIKNDIAIYAVHTALDMASGGVSYRMAQELDLINVKTLIPERKLIDKLTVYVPKNDADQLKKALFNAGAGSLSNYNECSFSYEGTGTFKGNEKSSPVIGTAGVAQSIEETSLNVTVLPHTLKNVLSAMHSHHPYEEISYELTTLNNSYAAIGMGAIGELKEEKSTADFIAFTKMIFKTDVVRSSLSRKRTIKRVAVLGGSGAFAIENALQSGADAYITADLKYHDFFKGENILLCDVGHYESERFTKNLLTEYLRENFSSFAVLCSTARTNPVNYY